MHRPAITPQSRHAFTLVEVLVALALTLLLVTAVYMALDLHYQMSTAGRGQATKAQLERAILQQMESDLRSVVFQLPETATAEGQAADEGSSTSSSSASGASSSTTETGSLAAGANSTAAPAMEITMDSSDEASAETSSGLQGDSNWIEIHVSRPSKEGFATSDLRSIRYFIAERGAEGVPGAMSDRFPDQRIDDPDHDSKFDHLVGLSRLDGDRLQLEHAEEEQRSDEVLAQQAELLAPEVISLEFRYFDGLDWYNEWNSEATGSLPAAVEITLGFVYEAPPVMNRRPGASTVRTRSIGYRRYVVRLPLAAPSMGDSVL